MRLSLSTTSRAPAPDPAERAEEDELMGASAQEANEEEEAVAAQGGWVASCGPTSAVSSAAAPAEDAAEADARGGGALDARGHDQDQETATAGAAEIPQVVEEEDENLGFPAARVAARMAVQVPSLAADAPAFMAAVLEVVASQVLQQAGDAAAELNCARIEPHHIRVAVRRDLDLVNLVGPDALEYGGLLRQEVPGPRCRSFI